MRAIAILAFSFVTIAAPAVAEDVPPFLADGAKYATDAASCTQDVEESEGYQLTSTGLYAYEFGCTFTSFQSVHFDGGEEGTDQFIGIASCGDDSGISRPDMILMMPSGEDTLFLTSQNDYAISTVWEKDGETDIKWLVQREFARCPK